MLIKKGDKKRGTIAISQILILVIGIIAISYAIGSSIKEIEAAEIPTPKMTQFKKAWEWFWKDGLKKGKAYSIVITVAMIAITILAIKNRDVRAVVQSVGIGMTAAWGAEKILHLPGPWALAAGGVLAIILIVLYKKHDQEVVTFECLPWDAATRGERCEECNKQGDLPCSEYQCRSLGQSCELINQGTDEEKCVWVNPNDINPPTIIPLESALLDDYDYKPLPIRTFPNKLDRGSRIEYNGGCVPAFTPFTFGIELKEEPGKCKLDVTRKKSFDEMLFFFSSGVSRYNHTYSLSLPGTSALESENISVENNGEYEIYIRCQDANENTNVGNYVFKYCVQKGPDTTPPLVVTTSILDKTPVGYGEDSVELIVYTNEPATCKWTHDIDKSYENMEEEMTGCATSAGQANAQMLYECGTTLTGLKDRQDNKFFIRCKDQPLEDEENRVEMREGYELTLIGTQPLIIDSVKPNETVKDSTDLVKVILEVETSAGYKEGEAICSYGETEQAEIDDFQNTNSYTHSQDLWLEEGDYTFYIKCVDAGGNSDMKKTMFHVETDTEEPVIVRAFKDELNLRIITNEGAECVYSSSNTECNYPFDEGLNMRRIGDEDLDHFAEWNTNTNYYIKCRDKYDNQPLPNQCSIIVKPFDLGG